MRILAATSVVFLALLGLAAPAAAHDIIVETEISGVAVVVRAEYDGAGPVIAAEVRVFDSEAARDPVIVGKTDRNGVFSFVPDLAGVWGVVVDDGYGHYKERRITIGDDQAVLLRDDGRLSSGMKMLVGVSVIFGVTGVWMWRKAGAQGAPAK